MSQFLLHTPFPIQQNRLFLLRIRHSPFFTGIQVHKGFLGIHHIEFVIILESTFAIAVEFEIMYSALKALAESPPVIAVGS